MKPNEETCGRLSWQAVMGRGLSNLLGDGWAERILSGLEKFGKRPSAAEDPLPFLYVG